MTGFQHSIPKSFYVYVHRRKTDGSVFYVGKGSGDRAWNQWARSKYWRNIVAKHGYTVEIVQDGMQEWWAFELERDLIAYYGRETLCNLTDGGDGASGIKRTFSAEHRAKIAAKAKGRKASPEKRLKMSESRKGKKLSKEHCAKVSQALLGRKHSEETKQKISKVHKGKKLSEQQKQGITLALGKRIECSNGMKFLSIGEAANWLRVNGYPKASSQSISRACTSDKRKAYGLRWKVINP